MNAETGPSQGASATSAKRDKRRQGIAVRINYISDRFEAERDIHYREMLHTLQNTLSSLHSGTNEEVLEQLADIEEKRDQELTRLNLWESYQIDRTEQEYQREIASANEEYTKLTLLVKERLMARLESQRKRLREDKALLDIANDHMVFLSGSYGYSQTNGEIPENSGTRNGNSNVNLANGYYSGGASGTPNSPGLGFAAFANDRRHLRRNNATASALEDASGVSGGEGRGGYGSARADGTGSGTGGASGSGKRRKVGVRANLSGDEVVASDRDALEGILFSKDRDMASAVTTTNGRQSKSYQPPAMMKNEEVVDDLNQLRTAAISLKRKRSDKHGR